LELTANLVLFAIVAAITPGPNNIMIMASGMNFGVRASMPHYFGICLGVPLVFLAIGYGWGFVFERYAVLHHVIKIIGVCYLFYLAWLIASSDTSDIGAQNAGKSNSKPLSFSQAMLIQWVNPKSLVVGTSVFAAYTSLDKNINWQIFLIVLVMFVVTIIAVGVWMLFGVGLRRLLTEPYYRRAFNMLMAALLLLSIWPIIKELAQTYLF